MKNYLFLPALSILLILPACNNSSQTGSQPETNEKKQKVSATKTADLARFKKFSYIDKQGTGSEAFSFLMPVGWIFNGGLIWLTDNPGMPATAAFTVSNPRGSEEFEVFPNQPFCWTSDQGRLRLFPVGSKYYGCEVRPIMNASQAMQQIVLPRFRSQVSDLRVVREGAVPELARVAGANAQQQAGLITNYDAAKARIEYTLNGTLMEEEIYAVVEAYSFPIQTWGGVVYNTNWTVDYIFSYKGEKGKLENASKIFETITYSFQVNKYWYNKYVQLVEYLIKAEIQHIHNVGDFSRRLSQISNEIREDNLRSWENRQAVNDRIAEDFSQYIRGVDEYYDPIEERAVELPSGYDNAWVNAGGEYVVSEDPDYNPNIGSNLNWERMQRR